MKRLLGIASIVCSLFGCGIRNEIVSTHQPPIKEIIIHQTGHIDSAFNADYKIVFNAPLDARNATVFEDDIASIIEAKHSGEVDLLQLNDVHGFVQLSGGSISVQLILVNKKSGQRYHRWFNQVYDLK